MIFPSSTHPVRNGAQVRINHLIHHFSVDLGWEVDFFCPQGLLRPPSWGPNIDYLRNVYIPRPLKQEKNEVPPLWTFNNLYRAMEDGMIVGFIRDIKQMAANFAERMKPVAPSKTFELLAMRSAEAKPKPQEPSKEMRGVHSPMSARLESYNERHYADSLKELVEENDYDVVLTTYA